MVPFQAMVTLTPPKDQAALWAVAQSKTLPFPALWGTDHAPHALEEKDRDIEVAPFGTIGLESAFGVIMTELFHGRKWKLENIVRKMSLTPADILKKATFGRLKTGEQANFILVDTDKEWTFAEEHVHSRSLNSCFYGKKLKGKVLYTFVKGYQYTL